MSTVSKAYKPGDVVLDGCKPFVCQVIDKHRDKRCHYCLKWAANLKKCGKCRQVMYCSRACQVADWEDIHKFNECKYLKDVLSICNDSNTELSRLLARLVIKVKFDPGSKHEVYKIWNDKYRKLYDLVSHEDDIDKNREGMGVLLCQLLITHFDQVLDHELDFAEVWRLYSMIKINSMRLTDSSRDTYAIALYIDGSAIDHDCQPNCERWYYGRTMQVRAVKQFETPGQQPTITYIDEWYKDRDYRRQLLSERYFFECQCRRCAEHTDREVDFDRLEILMRKRPATSEHCTNWDELIKVQRSVIGEHYSTITNALYKKFETFHGCYCRRKGDQHLQECKDLADELRRELAITHGEQHLDYRIIMNRINVVTRFG